MKRSKRVLTAFLLLFFLISWGQKTEKLRLKKYKLVKLSDSLAETSGLVFLNDKFYTFNDGGNPSEIYQISPVNGAIIKKLPIPEVNKDWEAITSDENNLYLGDFGNNAGKRKDLKIFKLNPEDSQKLEKIEFQYKEQTDFAPPYLNHNFDAEAMVFLDGKIHLFTKEWHDNSVSHYVIDPNITEKQTIQKTETYNTGYVVTDASYFEGKLYTVGYTRNGKVYMSVFQKDEYGNFFNLPSKKYKLGNAINVGQVEGIAVNKNGIYISNERFSKYFFFLSQNLYFIPFEKFQSFHH